MPPVPSPGNARWRALLRSVLAFNVAARMLFARIARPGRRPPWPQVARLGARRPELPSTAAVGIAMPFNSEGMYRACIDRRGRCMIVTSNVSA